MKVTKADFLGKIWFCNCVNMPLNSSTVMDGAGTFTNDKKKLLPLKNVYELQMVPIFMGGNCDFEFWWLQVYLAKSSN